MGFIDSKLHRWIYRLFVKGDFQIIRMKSMWCAIVKDGCFYGTWYGIPEKSIIERSGRFYSWPYFHGYLFEGWRIFRQKIKTNYFK